MDSNEDVIFIGYTDANFYPITGGAVSTTHQGGATDAVMTKLTLAGTGASDLLYSTYLGGSVRDRVFGIELDSNDDPVITGWTEYHSVRQYPVTYGAYDTSPNGVIDSFVSKFSFPDTPAYDDTNWIALGTEVNDATVDAADIINSGTDKLYYQLDDVYAYFLFYLVGDPDPTTYTYGVVLDEGGEGTYNYAMATYGYSNYITIYAWDGDNWNPQAYKDSENFQYDSTSDFIQFAIPRNEIGLADSETWDAKAVTHGTMNNAFLSGTGYYWTNDPQPAAATGDYTGPGEIPEFGPLIVPVLSMMAMFVIVRRRRTPR